MIQIFQSLYQVLNKDINFSFRSVEDVEGIANLQENTIENTKTEDDLRFLTVKGYIEQPIKRKSNVPFQLRYAAYGEASNLMCAYSYAWHNEYRIPRQGAPNALDFAIEFDDVAVSSATIVFDHPDIGLLAEKLFPDAVAALRSQYGYNLCELTAFSLSKARRSRRVIAGLMHLIFLYARQSRQMQGMLALTRTHHVGIYEKLFGFCKLAENNNVVLVFIPFDVMRTRIRQFGGNPDIEQESAGLYKYFFQAKDEAGLLFRLLEHLAASGTREG